MTRSNAQSICAIDPGPVLSTAVLYYPAEGYCRPAWLDVPNAELAAALRHFAFEPIAPGLIGCEWISSYGMPVGADVFDTCRWVGIFEAAIATTGADLVLVPRKDVKLHLCGSSRAKDANVRQALIDQFGPGRQAAIGTKKRPGPLYGVSNHAWAALAVAVYLTETRLQ